MSNSKTIPASEYRNLATTGRRRKPQTKWIEKPEAAKPKPSTRRKAAAVPPVRASGRTWQFTYSGKGVGLNELFGRADWQKRDGLVKKFDRIFQQLIMGQQVPRMDYFRIEMAYRSLHDPDGVTPMVKFFADALKKLCLPEDAPRVWRGGFEVVPNFKLPHNTFVFTLIELVEA